MEFLVARWQFISDLNDLIYVWYKCLFSSFNPARPYLTPILLLLQAHSISKEEGLARNPHYLVFPFDWLLLSCHNLCQ